MDLNSMNLSVSTKLKIQKLASSASRVRDLARQRDKSCFKEAKIFAKDVVKPIFKATDWDYLYDELIDGINDCESDYKWGEKDPACNRLINILEDKTDRLIRILIARES